jgi:hypothetical protein
MEAAIELVDTYFWPMTMRVHRVDAIGDVERNAQRIAKYLVRKRPAEVNMRELRRTVASGEMKEPFQFTNALQLLEECGWVARKPGQPPAGGRWQRTDYTCNLQAIQQHWPRGA